MLFILKKNKEKHELQQETEIKQKYETNIYFYRLLWGDWDRETNEESFLWLISFDHLINNQTQLASVTYVLFVNINCKICMGPLNDSFVYILFLIFLNDLLFSKYVKD